jgi:hypothetical protein
MTACLRTGAGIADAAGARGPSGQGLRVIRDHDPANARSTRMTVRSRSLKDGLILGLGSSAIGTLVKRTSRFTMLLHLPRLDGHDAAPRAKNGPALAGHGAEAFSMPSRAPS